MTAPPGVLVHSTADLLHISRRLLQALGRAKPGSAEAVDLAAALLHVYDQIRNHGAETAEEQAA